MKKYISLLHIAALLLVVFLLGSCNTYKWQRKRYYNPSKEKNWNTYNDKKSEKEDK